jgi:hypothetical protein
MRPSDFLADFFSASTGSIYLCSLPNERGNGQRPAEICGRGDFARFDELALHRWDKKDRGTFFACNTMQPRQARRSKETTFEITCLHCDIDLAKVDLGPGAVLARLGQLPCLPSKIVNSGHGHHCYWLLNEAETATPELISKVESLLRKLADVVGGDPAVCEVARLMRLPGSYNTKNGDRIPVQVIVNRPLRYELDDLADWISEAPCLIPRKGAPQDSNPFLSASMPGGGPAVDVDGRLSAMRFQGAGDSSIHQTQISTTAALLNQGASIDETVAKVLAATRAAAGDAGSRWNWHREEEDVRRMCADWQRKKLNGQQPPKHAINPLDDLMTKEFKPVDFLVPDLIPAEGVTLLAAKSKVGKSWMLYDICISAALGRELLGGRKPKQGYSLYLALEDSQKRLRFRGEKLLGLHMGPCPGVHTATTWDRVDRGGLDLIRNWVLDIRARGHTVVCVAIDVLQMIRPLGGERQSVYQRDYMAVQGLRTLAAELGIAIIVAHHQRKGGAEDLQDTISGTQGLPAAADASIVLERQMNGGFILDVRGRDIEAQQLAATFDKETCRWYVGGDASEMRRSETRRAITEALRTVPEGMNPAEVAAVSELKASTVRGTLARMVRDGEAKKVRGKYVIPGGKDA